jgi:outer membrane protein assembly factor BamB
MTGVDTATGRAEYNIDAWMFTDAEDRLRYTDVGALAPGEEAPPEYTGTEASWCPGLAARNWQNDAYSPQTGLLYTATDTSCSTMIVVEGQYNTDNYRLREFVGPTYYEDEDGNPLDYVGQLQANDPVAGQTAWSIEWQVNNSVPILATAGGLVFQGGSNDGAMHAYNAATGEPVWSFSVGSQFSQSAVSYMHDGHQYIAIIASGSSTGQVAVDNNANDADRYRRAGSTLFIFTLPQTVAGGM